MTAGQTLKVTLDATVPAGEWEHRAINIQPPAGAHFSYSGTDNPTVGQVTATESGTATYRVQFWVDDVVYSLDVDVSD